MVALPISITDSAVAIPHIAGSLAVSRTIGDTQGETTGDVPEATGAVSVATGYSSVWPPSTTRSTPLVKLASSDAR
jgi:hypothetical protein